MATYATQVSERQTRAYSSWLWFREFIQWEVASYPGRANTVARMTVTATLAMLIVVTFRIPNAFLAALYAILLARENLAATWRGGRIVLLGFACASLYTLLGMMLFRGSPITHFFWVIGSLYLVFFVIRTSTNYAAAAAFAIPVGITLPLWDRSLPSQLQVEGTLWPVLIIAVGAGVTVATEAVYRIFDRSDPLITSIDDVLLTIQQIAENVSTYREPPKSILVKLGQYQMTGTGRLRLTLQRQGVDPTRRAQRGALISLTGRLIALASDLARTSCQPSDDDTTRLRALSQQLGAIRKDLRASGRISTISSVLDGGPSSVFPMLQEMERIITLIGEVFHDEELVRLHGVQPEKDASRPLFLPDASTNPEYQRFAFAGCLTATACYVLYNVIDWPGIGQTCVITCIVTALSTVGNSLQAQSLRFAGFVVGGLLMGISAQVLILPAIDTVFGFTLFFAAGTAIAAWFATSSPRLSFFGVQMALSFYFVNLQDAHIQTDLAIARDKVMGVFLGIVAMGLIFDRFGTKSDARQLHTILVRSVRMLAQLVVCPVAYDRVAVASQVRRLRSQINDNFASLESLMDAARFEFQFRHRRQEDIPECRRIEKLQPELRSIFLLELSLLSHRERSVSTSAWTTHQTQELDRFLTEYSRQLLHAASWIAGEEPAARPNDDFSHQLRDAFADNSQAIPDICERMVSSLSMLEGEC